MIISAYCVPLLVVASTLKRQHHATQAHARYYYELVLQDKTLSSDDHKEARESIDIYIQDGLDSGNGSRHQAALMAISPVYVMHESFDELNRKAADGCVHSMDLLRWTHTKKIHDLQKSRRTAATNPSPAEYNTVWGYHDKLRKLFMRQAAEQGHRRAQVHMIDHVRGTIDGRGNWITDVTDMENELFYWLRRYASQCVNNSLANSDIGCVKSAIRLLFGESATLRSNDNESRKCLGLK